MTRIEIETLINMHLDDARVLSENNRYSSAYYHLVPNK